MTITVEIRGETIAEIRERMLVVLGLPTAREPAVVPEAPETPAEAPDAPLRKRGRPRKNADAPATRIEAGAAQPAVADNTGSLAARESPPPVAEPEVPTADGNPPAAAVGAPLDATGFRAKLQVLASSVEGGFDKLKRTLEAHGFQYVRQVPPDKYALILRDAELLT